MAGLLDGGLAGDDTVKDEYGQTQADRRDPIWSGLIRAGLLAVAGGGKLMPEQRAQYLAQAGGALADIPKDMQAAASAAAQQKLRGQQLDEGKRKVADRDRIRAMMQTPEIADIVNNATGADKIAIQAAIQTGDIGALNAAIGNLDKSGINAERLNIAREKLDLAKAKAEGTFQGNGMDAQAMNVLMAGKADSKEYYLAYNHLSKARTTVDPQTGLPVSVQPMDLKRFPPPTWGSDAPTPAPQPQPPNPDGTTPPPAPAPAPAPAGQPTVTTGSTPVVPRQVPEATLKVFSTNMGQLNKIDSVLADLKNNPDIKVGTAMTQVLGRLPIGAVGTDALNALDPKGVNARALISDIGTLVLHDRSGAAVTVSEYPRLAPFIPKVTDPPDVIRTKLANFQKQLELEIRYHYDNLPVAARAQAPPDVTARFGKPAAAATAPEYVIGPDGKPMLKPKE